jgi:acyl-coenzyme A thioesterase PaaI-like protein
MTKIFSFTASPARLIKNGWSKLQNIPCGKRIFSKIAGYAIPYTGSISPIVQQIENGHASVLLRDKRKVRNHLNSVHAIALANLGEFTTGLSLIPQLNDKAKAILVKIEVEYLKKARGDLIAKAFSSVLDNTTEDTDYTVIANITNTNAELVCRVTATWRVRP